MEKSGNILIYVGSPKPHNYNVCVMTMLWGLQSYNLTPGRKAAWADLLLFSPCREKASRSPVAGIHASFHLL